MKMRRKSLNKKEQAKQRKNENTEDMKLEKKGESDSGYA